MACKIALISAAILLLLALTHAAPAEEKPVDILKEEAGKDDIAPADDKEDLKTAASHWGGHWGGYGHYGGHYGGYPHYGYGWGYPSFGYGYWPYGGYYGHGYGGYGGYGWW
ncbi:glycine-rich protein 3-like [Helicoverpa zea]|uniref:glycine-rich protein 3-like n=1 Tax=Helicoverpa zea TaxID=7113 RepID=UPI001F5AF733|nr:glycine-rich protein 3-like [Helicoverpa zea]